MKQGKSKFLKVRCKCENEQRVFSHSTSKVKCDKCGEVLAEPAGGSTNILGKILE
ncbi:MAG: 30S ribosomal protein S27e [Candidatus Micrarchaeota archaeon]